MEGAHLPPDGRFMAVDTGKEHACAVRVTGEISCWGAENQGQSSP